MSTRGTRMGLQCQVIHPLLDVTYASNGRFADKTPIQTFEFAGSTGTFGVACTNGKGAGELT